MTTLLPASEVATGATSDLTDEDVRRIEPLMAAHVTPRLIGHRGTTPGLNVLSWSH